MVDAQSLFSLNNGRLYCSFQRRHSGCDSVSNHHPHDCLLNRLFRRRSKKTLKLRVTGLCVPGTGEFPAQMASNPENVYIWWRHHVHREMPALLQLLIDNDTLPGLRFVIFLLTQRYYPKWMETYRNFLWHLNTLRPRQKGRRFPDDIFKYIFLNENVRISLNISLKFIPKVRINNILALVQIMAWRWPGDKPLSNQWWVIHWRIYASLGLNELTHPRHVTHRCVNKLGYHWFG